MAANLLNINKQWIVGGVDALYVGFWDNNGLFAGGHGTLQKGEQSFMRRWQAVKSVAAEIPDKNRVTITGDDRPQGFFVFDRTDSPTVAIQTGDRVQALEMEMQGLKDYERNQFRVLLVDPSVDLASRQNLALIAHSQAKANEYGVVHEVGWQNLDFWKGEITPGAPTGVEEQTGHAFDQTFTMERESTYPDHVALEDANEGTDQASGAVWADQYRLIRGAFFGDGTLTQINLPVTPAADHTDSDINAADITKRTAAGVVTTLTMGTDFTITLSPPYVTLLAVAVDDERYVIAVKF